MLPVSSGKAEAASILSGMCGLFLPPPLSGLPLMVSLLQPRRAEPPCDTPALQQGGASLEAKALLQGGPQRWLRGPPLVLELEKAIKDPGVAQGMGRHAKEMQAARAKVAFDRLGRVAWGCHGQSWQA